MAFQLVFKVKDVNVTVSKVGNLTKQHTGKMILVGV